TARPRRGRGSGTDAAGEAASWWVRTIWLIGAGLWLYLLLAILWFSPADPPSTAVAPLNNPVSNITGAFGAFAAYWAIAAIGPGVWVLLAFTFFMGLMMSRLIAMVLGFSNGAELVMTAFGGTASVFFVMAGLATSIKRDLSGLQQWLTIGVILLLVGFVINMFVASSTGMVVLSMLAVAIFSAFLLVDLKRIVDGGETNYISATLALYLNLINIFQNLLMLLGIFGGNRD
ncbi:MAG: Bax inhibitor-1 family protein, partial [Burkholderiaceae bacterium]